MNADFSTGALSGLGFLVKYFWSKFVVTCIFVTCLCGQNLIFLIAASLVAQVVSADMGFELFQFNVDAVIWLPLIYFTFMIGAFWSQLHLSENFIVHLNKDLDSVYNSVSVNESPKRNNLSVVIKDVTSEFPRFAANVTHLILDLVKNFITAVVVFGGLIYTTSGAFYVLIPLVALYLMYWLGTLSFFRRAALTKSQCYADRQRFAEFRYRKYGYEIRKEASIAQRYYVAISRAVSLTINTKTLAILPRLALESAMLGFFIYVVVSDINTAQVGVLAVSAIRVIPALQGLSGGISGLQSNYPAFIQYLDRRNFLAQRVRDLASYGEKSVSTALKEGSIFESSRGLKYKLSSKISIPDSGFILVKGDSGIGKTTFVNLLFGLDVLAAQPSDFCPSRMNVRFFGQNETVLTGSSAEFFADLPVDIRVSDKAQAYCDALFVGSSRISHDNIMSWNFGPNSGLSGGELKRFCLLRNILQLQDDENILIWDEPFEGLHKDCVERFLQCFKAMETRLLIAIDHNSVRKEWADSVWYLRSHENNSVVDVCSIETREMEGE